MKKLLLIDFIRSHPADWETILKKEYEIRITRDGNYAIFNYTTPSSFTFPIVRECRGIILDMTTLRPVCVPFFKFGNYGESYADSIDWQSAKVQEKIDGSLIKLWFDNDKWHVSTNGTINAFNTEVADTVFNISLEKKKRTFGQLFVDTWKESNFPDFDSLNRNKTYMFEFVGPFTRIVIDYPKNQIFHIGTRDNITLEEEEGEIGVPRPQVYPLYSLSDCIAAAEKLDEFHEGYVVVDKNYHRVKVKSPLYIFRHYFSTQKFNTKALLNVVLEKQEEELLTYFPEYRPFIDIINTGIKNIYQYHINLFSQGKNFLLEGDKPYAEWVNSLKNVYSSFLFSLKNKEYSLEEFVGLISIKQGLKKYIIKELNKLLGDIGNE